MPLIFNHFTFYLSISRDQLSSVFSWSLTRLARALVMFLFFFYFLCVTKVTSYKTSLGLLNYFPRAQVMVAPPNCPKILLLLSSAHATIGGDQVITQIQVE